MGEHSSMLNDAVKARGLGISVLAIVHGTKKAAREWGHLQERLPTIHELERDFKNGSEIGFAMGAGSGNLEAIDFDERDFYIQWQEVLWANGTLLDRLVVEDTPSGGCHVVYRCEDPVGGNQKLAYKVSDDGEVKIAIETRGHGGYIKAAPSDGYRVVQLSWSRIPTISAADREMLLDAARELDEYKTLEPEGADDPPPPRPPRTDGEESPIERFNRTHSLASILEGAGWRYVRTVKGGRQQWIRPGKALKDGISGTITADGQMFICFTSNAAPFEPFERGRRGYYSAFAAHAALDHGGDFKAAARDYIASEPRSSKTPPKAAPGSPDAESDAAGEETPTAWRRMADVESKLTEWLYKPLLPIGYTAMLQGDPGIGKSTVAIDWAARVSCGSPWPGDTTPCEPATVLILSCEDSLSEVIKPRLESAGANMENIHALEGDGAALDLADLEAMIVQESARLVIIDPIVAYVGAQRDINRANETREFMALLKGVSERTRCCILLIHHMNKASGAKALYRSVGSIDFVAAVRSVMMAGCDPDNHDACAIAHIKCNLAPMAKPMGYEIGEMGLAWTGKSDLSAERMSEMPEKRSANAKREDAASFLKELLKDGALTSEEVMEMGEEMSYSRSTLFRAKADLGSLIKCEKQTSGIGWQWRLNEDG